MIHDVILWLEDVKCIRHRNYYLNMIALSAAMLAVGLMIGAEL